METSQRQFLSVIKPMLKFNRAIGLLPTVIKENASKSTSIGISRSAEIYSRLIILVLYVYAFSITKWALSVKYQQTFLLCFYWYSRVVISALMHASCWLHRHNTLQSLQKADALDIGPSISWKITYVWLPFVLAFMKIMVLFLAQTNFFPLYGGYLNVFKAIVAASSDSIPTVVLIAACSAFVCQVTILRYGIIELNQEIKITLQQGFTSPAFRQIIQRHHNLRRLCSVLNRTYGRLMFLATTAVFAEVTFVIFYVLTTTDILTRTSNLSALMWAILHTIPAIVVMGECQKTESEADKTNQICLYFKEMDLDKTYRVQLEVQEWTLRLRQLPMKFTACGFFYLNGGQLETIMFTIMGYVVILIQNNSNIRTL